MKNLVFGFILLSTSAFCQPVENVISPFDFYNIRINNVRLDDLMNSDGNPEELEKLLGIPLSKKISEYNTHFTYEGFEIGYSSAFGHNGKLGLGAFEIMGNSCAFAIRNTQITIGDNIDRLGKMKFNTQTNGDKSIILSPREGNNHLIVIEFNQETFVITKIIFFEMT